MKFITNLSEQLALGWLLLREVIKKIGYKNVLKIISVADIDLLPLLALLHTWTLVYYLEFYLFSYVLSHPWKVVLRPVTLCLLIFFYSFTLNSSVDMCITSTDSLLMTFQFNFVVQVFFKFQSQLKYMILYIFNS